MRRRPRGQRSRGQALAEFALVFPIAVMVIFGILVFGITVFYQHQLTNVAREAARWAGIHSSTAICPTASWRDPQAPPSTYPAYPYQCDGPNNPNDPYPWPRMTEHARSFAWGMNASAVWVNACWSGFAPTGTSTGPGFANADWPSAQQDPVTGAVLTNDYVPCTISGIDPTSNSSALGCQSRMTTLADDPSSDLPGNRVTVYACYDWSPPLAGLLMIPNQITLRAVITEVIERQQ